MELTAKVLKLIGLPEAPVYTPDQLKDLPKAMVAKLTGIDGNKANGFTQNEFKKYLAKEGLKGIARFYPLYEIVDTPDCLHPTLKSGKLVLQSSNDSADTQKLIKELGLPVDTAERTHILFARYKKSAPIIVVVADIHQNVNYNFLAHKLVENIKTDKPMPLFYEEDAGVSVYTQEKAQKFWEIEARTLNSPNLLTVTESDLNQIPAPKDRMTLVLAIKLARYLKNNLKFTSIPTFAEIRNLAQKDPVVKDLLAMRDPRFLWALVRPDNSQFNLETKDPKTLASWKGSGENPPANKANRDIYAINDEVIKLHSENVDAGKCDYSFVMKNQFLKSYERAHALVDADTDKRTQNWEQNIEAVIKSHKSPVVFVQGGAYHIPKLVKDLHEYSVIVFEPLVKRQ